MVFCSFMKNCCVAFLLCFITINMQSQEKLKPLSGRINASVYPKQVFSQIVTTAKTTSTTPLDLPFFDDFSSAQQSAYASQRYWTDSNVYVNTGYPIAPLSIGVATFDGLNSKGYPYNINASVSSSANADYLTSQPINLKRMGAVPYSANDSLYLSFYYQAEGRGDSPEPNDSLCLEFFKKKQNKWQKVWGVKGYNPSSTDTIFHRVSIYIKDTAYLDSSFQFRFRNKATLSGSLDHWHLDYVYLDKNRTNSDSIRSDLAFTYHGSSMLKNYWVMPYRQFIASEMAPAFKNYLRNNTTTTIQSAYQYTVYNSSNINVDYYNGGPRNITPFQNNGYQTFAPHTTPTLTYTPVNPMIAPDYYTVKHALNFFASPASDVVRENDTLIHIQRFDDFYAYDDGAAEVGYYLNTYGAKTALRYTLNVLDTLRALKIYFDPIVDGQQIQTSSFRIMVWADGGGFPGSLIYKDSLMNPTYLQGSHNLVPTYTLTSCLSMGPGTYFIGIQQTTNKALNIGFDKNTNHMNELYYDIGNGWTQSAVPGSLMINPVMGCTILPPPVGLKEHDFNSLTFGLFPNPSHDFVTIHYPKLNNTVLKVRVFSSLGETVLENELTSDNLIDINSLSNGVYFVQLFGNGVNTAPQKLIISR